MSTQARKHTRTVNHHALCDVRRARLRGENECNILQLRYKWMSIGVKSILETLLFQALTATNKIIETR